MYFSQYRSKKSARKKNSVKGQKSRKLKKGLIRFLILAVIIISIIPVVYLSDSVYKLAAGKPDRQKTIQTSYMDKLFRVQSVRVNGNNFISMDEINPYLQQVKGVNIFRYDIEDLAKRLQNNSWIKDVSVRREPPSSIAVNIVERTPAVYIDSNGSLQLTDEEGTLLGQKDGLTLELPVVYGISLQGARTGDRNTSEALRSAIRVRNELSSLPWVELSQTGIEVDERTNITLHLKGYRIRLGQGKYREKLLRFNEIAKDLKSKGIPYKEVDLRFDNQVVVQTL